MQQAGHADTFAMAYERKQIRTIKTQFGRMSSDKMPLYRMSTQKVT